MYRPAKKLCANGDYEKSQIKTQITWLSHTIIRMNEWTAFPRLQAKQQTARKCFACIYFTVNCCSALPMTGYPAKYVDSLEYDE